MALEIRRGRLQSLYRYMPEQTYNWPDRGSFRGQPDVDARPLDIPKGWIKRPLRRLLRGFTRAHQDAGRAWRGEEVIERGEFELLEPRTLRGELFPRTFACPRCGRFISSEDRPDRVRCFECDIRMRQVVHVEYHRCGYLGGLLPPRCDSGCNSPMTLTGPNGKSIADVRAVGEWRWACSRCRRPSRGVIHGCPECRRGTVWVMPSDANRVYYAQYVTVINPPSETDYAVLESPSVYPAAIAQSLGLLPSGLAGLRDAANSTGSQAGRDMIRAQLAQLLGLDPDEPTDRQKLEGEVERAAAIRSSSAAKAKDWEAAVTQLGLQEEVRAEIGEECVSLALAREAHPLSLDDLAAEAEGGPLEPLYRRRYPEALDRLGLAEVVLLREFPIAHVVAGYTREDSNPRNLDGLEFSFFRGEGGPRPMYGQRVKTEALLFRLDPTQVVRWLHRSGVIGEPGDDSSAAWLFSHLEPVTSIFEEPPDRLTASVLGLVHSFSHRAIRALAVRSGLAAESLAEHILLFNTAFLVYPGARSDFVLGGLEHVFRNFLHECLETMVDDPRCVFDPPCRQRGGACAVCMFVGEVTCERFNTALARHYLFGGRREGVDWRGYWEPA